MSIHEQIVKANRLVQISTPLRTPQKISINSQSYITFVFSHVSIIDPQAKFVGLVCELISKTWIYYVFSCNKQKTVIFLSVLLKAYNLQEKKKIRIHFLGYTYNLTHAKYYIIIIIFEYNY